MWAGGLSRVREKWLENSNISHKLKVYITCMIRWLRLERTTIWRRTAALSTAEKTFSCRENEPTQTNSSQVQNFDAVGTVSFGHHVARVDSSWIELAWIWSNSNLCPTRAKFSTVFGHLSQLKPTLAKVFCYSFRWLRRGRSQTIEWFSCELAWLGGTAWPPADASFDFAT